MDESSKIILQDWVVTLSVVGLLYGVGKIIDGVLNERDVKRIKDEITEWWVDLSVKKFNIKELINNSLIKFTRLFDSIYGAKHFTLKCFIKSSFISRCNSVSIPDK